MARVRMVTRTIPVTKATFLALNIETAEPSNVTVELPRTYKTETEILAAAAEFMPENTRAVSLVDSEVLDIRYGMPETEFIKFASIITDNADSADDTDNEEG